MHTNTVTMHSDVNGFFRSIYIDRCLLDPESGANCGTYSELNLACTNPVRIPE